MILGIDIGGTNTKFLVVDGKKIISRSTIKTNTLSETQLVNDICTEAERMKNEYKIDCIGVGTPGSIVDGRISPGNLPFRNYPLGAELSKILKCPVKVENDANCAALGEFEYSLKEECSNVVLITLGTGIGGGIVIDKKLYRGKFSTGEFGHTVVQNDNGLPCVCGRCGCWEQYASVTALAKQAVEEAENHPDSILYRIYKEQERLDAKLIFRAMDDGCDLAVKVFDEYLKWVALGIRNIANIFGPDKIIISGGITQRGEEFINKLREYANTRTIIDVAKLKNDAGAFGATMLF